MLLTENFIKHKSEFDELNKYQIRQEKITNVYYKLYLEYKNISICLDIEESEPYVSFFVIQKNSHGVKVYYGLSDYSYLEGEKYSIFQSESEKNAFIQGFKTHIKKYKRLFSSDKNGDGIVVYIYSFLNEFVKKLL